MQNAEHNQVSKSVDRDVTGQISSLKSFFSFDVTRPFLVSFELQTM